MQSASTLDHPATLGNKINSVHLMFMINNIERSKRTTQGWLPGTLVVMWGPPFRTSLCARWQHFVRTPNLTAPLRDRVDRRGGAVPWIMLWFTPSPVCGEPLGGAKIRECTNTMNCAMSAPQMELYGLMGPASMLSKSVKNAPKSVKA